MRLTAMGFPPSLVNFGLSFFGLAALFAAAAPCSYAVGRASPSRRWALAASLLAFAFAARTCWAMYDYWVEMHIWYIALFHPPSVQRILAEHLGMQAACLALSVAPAAFASRSK